MAETFKWYKDAALNTLFDTASEYIEADQSTQDTVLYFGSTDDTVRCQANSDPGIDAIVITPSDSDPGNGHETTGIKLATSSAGLDSATAGAALDIGTQVLGGVANAVAVHIRLTDETGGTVKLDTDTYLAVNELVEAAI